VIGLELPQTGLNEGGGANFEVAYLRFENCYVRDEIFQCHPNSSLESGRHIPGESRNVCVITW